jgi:cobalt-zinc-cadmium efflux system outer membrane protein
LKYVFVLFYLSTSFAEFRCHAFQTTQPYRLSLTEAVQLAEEYNPRLLYAKAGVERASAAIVTSRAYPNPEFNTFFGNQYIRLLGAVPGFMEHYSASQQIELPSVRATRRAAATQGQVSSRLFQDDARLTVRTSVKQAFYEALRRRAEYALLEENLRLVEDLQRRIAVQVQEGEAARLELTRADSEVAIARTLTRSADLRYRNAIAILRTAVSAPLPANFEPEGQIDISTVLPTLEELREEMYAKHPMLAALRSEVERERAELENEMAQRKPAPVFRGEYERQPDLGFYRFGISIPVPIWNRREGPIGEAAAEVNQARAALRLRQLEMTSMLEAAYGQYEVARQQVASFQQGVLPGAEAAVEAAQAAFRFGERGIIDVLDAQRVLRTVRLDYLDAQYDLQTALIDIELLRAYEAGTNAGAGVTP